MVAMTRSATVTLTEDDYAAAKKLHVLNSFRGRAPLSAMAVIAALYVIFLFATFAGVRSSGLPNEVTHALFLFLLASPIVTYLLLAPYVARRTFRQQKTLHQPVTYSWSATGLKVSSINGEWWVPWTDYLKWSENPKVALFYHAQHLFQILPKRALTAEQLADLRECLSRSS